MKRVSYRVKRRHGPDERPSRADRRGREVDRRVVEPPTEMVKPIAATESCRTDTTKSMGIDERRLAATTNPKDESSNRIDVPER